MARLYPGKWNLYPEETQGLEYFHALAPLLARLKDFGTNSSFIGRNKDNGQHTVAEVRPQDPL